VKRCTKCGEEKPLEDFKPDKRVKSGRTARCRKCISEYHKEWSAKNRDKVRANYWNNREKRLAAEKARREADPEKAREKSTRNRELHGHKWAAAKKAWREKNLERAKAQIREWQEANPERMRELSRKSEAMRRARKLRLPYEEVDFGVVFERDAGVCGICGTQVDPEDWHLDHVVPLAAGGHHLYTNVQVSHPKCNMSKGARVTSGHIN
jgi:5-methylcytosine-specific restriction endonuclease McrA